MDEVMDVGAEITEDISSTVDTGAEPIAEETGAETDLTAADTAGETERTKDEEVSQDGRTLPKHLQAALRQLKDAAPENAKAVAELRKAFFQSSAYAKTFGSPAQAQSAKVALDLVGGQEGIAKLQSHVSAIELVDQSFEQGDPVVIDDVAADFPDGFKKLIPYAIEKLQQMDVAAYGKALQPHVYGAIEAAGLGEVLAGMQQALQENKPEDLKRLLGQTLAWLDRQKQQAGQRKAGPDPERQKFETERQEFKSQQERAFRGDIGRQTISYQNQLMERQLAPYLKGKQLSTEAKTDLADGVNREISRLLKANSAYQTQVRAMLSAKTRDPQAIVRYINAAVGETVPNAVKSVWSRRYGVMPARQAAQRTQATANTEAARATAGAPIKIAQKPNREDVDWAKDPKRMLFITSKAYMKSGPYKGKFVSWA